LALKRLQVFYEKIYSYILELYNEIKNKIYIEFKIKIYLQT